eukprot:g7423.t1
MSARTALEVCIRELEDSTGEPVATKASASSFSPAPVPALELLDRTIATLETSLGLKPGDTVGRTADGISKEAGGAAGGYGERRAKGKGHAESNKTRGVKGASKPTVSSAEQPDGSKIDLRVGLITNVWTHESADKLYCEEIDVGEGAPRNIASGLVPHYSLDEMKGRRVIVMCNLKPRNLKGFKSQGMVVCAVQALEEGKEKVELVAPPAGSTIGERLSFEGLAGGPFEPVSAAQMEKKKVLEKILPELATDGEGTHHGDSATAGSRVPVGDFAVRSRVVRDSAAKAAFGGPITTRKSKRNIKMQAGGQRGSKPKGSTMLQGPNLELVRILIQGEVAAGAVAAGLAFFAQVNPFVGTAFSWPAVGLGCLGALPIFLVSVLLEKSGVDFFRKIDQDTKLYVVQVFGAQRNWPVVSFWSLVLAANAGFFEEVLFRGVIQQWLSTVLGGIPALGIASVLFGLAHSPVPGASSFTEACYGANFGLLYMISGGNILVPIVAHVVYDLLTFLEVHQRATEQLKTTLEGSLPQKEQEKKNVATVVKKFNLSQKFVDMSYGIFQQLDLDKNGAIDLKELQLGLRTFGKFASAEETRQIMKQADLDKNNALTFDEWVRLLAINYSVLLEPKAGKQMGA